MSLSRNIKYFAKIVGSIYLISNLAVGANEYSLLQERYNNYITTKSAKFENSELLDGLTNEAKKYITKETDYKLKLVKEKNDPLFVFFQKGGLELALHINKIINK